MSNDNKPPQEHELMNAGRNIHTDEIERHVQHISREFRDGFEFLRKYPKSVTIFGSSVSKIDTAHCKKAEELGGRIVRELGYAVVTGGGPGIMEAAAKGAKEAGGASLGLHISLPHERAENAYATSSIRFSYFFSRKTMMAYTAEAYVFFPGGYGTLDELFGILTLIQTGKIPRIPVMLVDSAFWNGLEGFLGSTLAEKYATIGAKDLKLFEITDSLDRVIEMIKKAPVSEWWRNIN